MDSIPEKRGEPQWPCWWTGRCHVDGGARWWGTRSMGVPGHGRSVPPHRGTGPGTHPHHWHPSWPTVPVLAPVLAPLYRYWHPSWPHFAVFWPSLTSFCRVLDTFLWFSENLDTFHILDIIIYGIFPFYPSGNVNFTLRSRRVRRSRVKTVTFRQNSDFSTKQWISDKMIKISVWECDKMHFS